MEMYKSPRNSPVFPKEKSYLDIVPDEILALIAVNLDNIKDLNNLNRIINLNENVYKLMFNIRYGNENYIALSKAKLITETIQFKTWREVYSSFIISKIYNEEDFIRVETESEGLVDSQTMDIISQIKLMNEYPNKIDWMQWLPINFMSSINLFGALNYIDYWFQEESIDVEENELFKFIEYGTGDPFDYVSNLLLNPDEKDNLYNIIYDTNGHIIIIIYIILIMNKDQLTNELIRKFVDVNNYQNEDAHNFPEVYQQSPEIFYLNYEKILNDEIRKYLKGNGTSEVIDERRSPRST